LLSAVVILIALANLNAYLLLQSLTPFWEKIGSIIPLVIFMPVGPLIWLYMRWTVAEKVPGKPGLAAAGPWTTATDLAN